MEILIISGLSGSGKSKAATFLEDIGYYIVDNLPAEMMVKFADFCAGSRGRYDRVALVYDVRAGEPFDLLIGTLERLKSSGVNCRMLFLEASTLTIINRYKETRRIHPLAGQGLNIEQAIAKEREIMQPLRDTANYIIDTTTLKPRELKERLAEIFSGESHSNAIQVELSSFGFKRGLPRQADLVYDVRFLPNPFYIKGLGNHTGLDADVRDFVLKNPITMEFVAKLEDLLAFLLPHYQEEGKRRLSIAVGCTGGAHRSVAIAERLGGFLRAKGYQVTVSHRDLALEQAHWKSRQEAE